MWLWLRQDFTREVRSRRFRVALGAAVAVYLSTYVVLSACGEWRSSQSGRARWPGGFPMTDILVWHPKGISGDWPRSIRGAFQFRGELPGLLFSPLLALDRWCVHRTKDLCELSPAEWAELMW